MSPLDVFNTLQQRFGRPMELIYIDADSLVFRVSFWDNQEFDYGTWDERFTQRFPGAKFEKNFRTEWLADLAKGYVRDPQGNMRPPMQAA